MDYKLEDLIDVQLVQSLQDKLNVIYSFPSAIIDNDGKVLTAVAWQDICTKFHRIHSVSEKECIKSDQYILEHLHEANPAVSYQCPHGLVDNATPIIIDGQHLGNFFTGQFFLEKPDLEFFKKQAKVYGFDEAEYLEAVVKTPIWSKEKLDQYLDFIKGFIEIIAGIGLKNLREIEANKKIKEGEYRFRIAFENSAVGIFLTSTDGILLQANAKVCKMLGYSADELIGIHFRNITHPDDESVSIDFVNNGINNPTESLYFEKRYIQKNGETLWAEVSSSLLKDVNDKPIYFISHIIDITERKKIKDELIQSKASLVEAQTIAEVGSWEHDVSKDLSIWSNEMFTLFDIDPQSITLYWQNLKPYIHPDDWENIDKKVTDASLKGISYCEEFRILRKDGQIIWAETRGNVHKDKSGKIVKLSGTVQNITERKRAEDLLRRGENEYKSTLEDLLSGVVVHASDSSIQYSNSEANHILGLTKEQMLGKMAIDPVWSFLQNDLTKLDLENYPANKVMSTRKPLNNYTLGINKPDQDFVTWVNVNAIPIFNENNILEKIIVNFVDITERMQSEEALRNSEEKLSTLFGTMTEMVVLHELVFNEAGEAINYRLTDCNNAFTKVTGIKKENVIGKLATEVYQTEFAPYLDEFSNVAITGKPYEYTSYFAPMDKHFSISVVSPQQNQFATITTDITAMQQIQKVISDKNKELENFLYVSSHDLRTPLVNVQGFSDRLHKQIHSIKTLINKCSLDPETEAKIKSIMEESIPKTLDFIFKNVSKMDILINALLEISRTGRVKMTIKKIDINKLIENIVSSLNFQITELSAKVITQQMPDCYGDENLLNQLFTNIVVNAIKYRNREKPLVLEISSKVEYKKVIYSFKDNGIGIEHRHLEKIWDVFYRVDSASPEDGDGIGLSLSKKIVDKHKGKIWAESEEGKGSVFSIELLTNEFSE